MSDWHDHRTGEWVSFQSVVPGAVDRVEPVERRILGPKGETLTRWSPPIGFAREARP